MAFDFREFPDPKKNKDILIFAHRHWVAFVSNILIAVFLLIIPLVIIFIAHNFAPTVFHGRFLNYLVVFGSIYYLIMLILIFGAWISYYYDIYILTSDSIVDITQNGIFNRKISQLPLASVENVSSDTKGFLQTFFNYGNVVVETAGARVENFLLKDIPNPQYFSDMVLKIHAQLIERELREERMAEREGVLSTLESLDKPEPTQVVVKEQPSQTKNFEEGEIKKDDLNRGGEVKL